MRGSRGPDGWTESVGGLRQKGEDGGRVDSCEARDVRMRTIWWQGTQ